MSKPNILLVGAWALAVFAQSGTIRPDGITRTTEEHRIDLSSCDEVEVSGEIRELQVQGGRFQVYWFKKYQDISRLTFTCRVSREVRSGRQKP